VLGTVAEAIPFSWRMIERHHAAVAAAKIEESNTGIAAVAGRSYKYLL